MKKKIDEAIGITIIVIVALFVGRYFLSGVEGYRKVEAKVSRALHIPQVTEKVVEVLNLGDERDTEEFQQERQARLEKEKRPSFDLDVPLGTSAVKPSYEVVSLIDKAYYPALHKAIKKAKKSIYVAMFIISMGNSASDPVRVLLNELIAAKKRGVDVKVMVENPLSSDSSLYEKNQEALAYLSKGGVEGSFDERKKELHDKFILIDEDILFVGNHNWSKQALTVNREVSVMVKSTPANPEFLKHFAYIKLARPEETKEGREGLIKELYKELLGRDKEG
ncbi:MAG: phospholipase D-like domain-containing protein [PVC group bacterium]